MNRFTLHLVLGIGICLTAMDTCCQEPEQPYATIRGAIVRGDTSARELALVFTGDEHADGGDHIAGVLERQQVKGSFFFTGNFYRKPEFSSIIRTLAEQGHYLGAHSDRHLLFCDWENRDSLLVSYETFHKDLLNNYQAMHPFGIAREDARFFLPPFEWYNDSISRWTGTLGFVLINFTQGTLSHADYTVPGTPGYRSSREIYDSIMDFESREPGGLNGFILLIHVGTVPERKDKFYLHLEELVSELKSKGYRLKRIDELVSPSLPG